MGPSTPIKKTKQNLPLHFIGETYLFSSGKLNKIDCCFPLQQGASWASIRETLYQQVRTPRGSVLAGQPCPQVKHKKLGTITRAHLQLQPLRAYRTGTCPYPQIAWWRGQRSQ